MIFIFIIDKIKSAHKGGIWFMYAYELFEKMKKIAQENISKNGSSYIKTIADYSYTRLLHDENLDKSTALNTVIGLFACVACNDGKLSYDEYKGMWKIFGSNPDYTYDDFFNTMSKFNKQEWRNQTEYVFKNLRTKEASINLICFAITVALLDNNLSENEELFITSLCGIIRDKFYR